MTRTIPSPTSSLAVLLAIGLTTAPAAARPVKKATDLFKEGRNALQAGRLDEACNLLRQSFMLEARVGTLLNLAECEEKRGHLLESDERWAQAAELATWQNDKRGEIAEQRRQSLQSRLPSLTVSSEDETKVMIRSDRDGEVKPVEPGRPTTLDPGRYRVDVAAACPTRSYEVTLVEGDRQELPVVPPGQALGRPKRDAAMWIAGWSTLAAGGALAAVGAGLGVGAAQKQSDAEPLCDANNTCTPEGLSLREEGIRFATGSTITFVLGGVGLAAGITLLVLSDRDSSTEVKAQVSPQGGRLIVHW
jgi:hypothetical protein